MKFFTIEELCKTNTGLVNIPGPDEVRNLEILIDNVLNPACEVYGKLIMVTSGFRSPEVNLRVGGSKTSQHPKGQAADLDSEDNLKLFNILLKMEFDQLIWEFGTDKEPAWIHVSFNSGHNRQMILKSVKLESGKTRYININIL